MNITKHEMNKNRRAMLAGSAALLAGGAALALTGAVPAAGDRDAELLVICSEIIAGQNYYERMAANAGVDDQIIDEICDKLSVMVHRMCEMRALTPAGWKARAQVILACSKQFYPSVPSDGETPLMVTALLRDLAEG